MKFEKEAADFLTVKEIPKPHFSKTKKEYLDEKEAMKKRMHFDGEGKALDKSYDSMGSEEKDEVHYEIESDNEPPRDEVGDVITVVKKGQVTKEILEVSSCCSLLCRWGRVSANQEGPTWCPSASKAPSPTRQCSRTMVPSESGLSWATQQCPTGCGRQSSTCAKASERSSW